MIYVGDNPNKDFVEIKKAVSLEKTPKEEVKEEKRRKSTVKAKTK